MPMLALVAALLSPTTAAAAGGCEVSIKPEMKGFYLNPTVGRGHVSKVSPPPPGGQCRLVAGDEILRINDRQVIGGEGLGGDALLEIPPDHRSTRVHRPPRG